MIHKQEKTRSVGVNTLLNSVGALIYMGCQWLITVLVVHLSSVKDAGNLSLAMSVTNMFFTIATFSIRDYQISDYKNSFSPSVYISTRYLTCCIAMALCTLLTFFSRSYSGYQRICIVLYMIYRIAEALVDVFQAFEQKLERMDCVFASFCARGILLLIGFSAVLAVTKNLLGAIICIGVTSYLVLFLYDFRVVKKIAPFHFGFFWRDSFQLLKECFPLMLNSFLLSAIVSIPRNQLQAIMGESALGIYASVATPAVIVQSAAMWLYTPLLTRFSASYQNKEKKTYLRLLGRVLVLIALLVLIILAVCVAFGHWGLELLFNCEIASYSYLLIPVVMTTIMIALNYFLGALLTVTRTMYSILLANGLAFLVSVFTCSPLIRTFGMNGVNITLYFALSASIVILVIRLVVALRKQFVFS